MANYGVDQGLGGPNVAASYDDDVPYTPAWQERAHDSAASSRDPGRTRIRGERREDARQEHGDRRCCAESLVPQRHDLSRHHQPADDVRLRRAKRRRLGALCRPGKIAAAVRLGAARVRVRLDPAAAPDERHVVLLQPHEPVAPREGRARRSARPNRRPREVREALHARPEREVRAHGMAARARRNSARTRSISPTPPHAPASSRWTTWSNN